MRSQELQFEGWQPLFQHKAQACMIPQFLFALWLFSVITPLPLLLWRVMIWLCRGLNTLTLSTSGASTGWGGKEFAYKCCKTSVNRADGLIKELPRPAFLVSLDLCSMAPATLLARPGVCLIKITTVASWMTTVEGKTYVAGPWQHLIHCRMGQS